MITKFTRIVFLAILPFVYHVNYVSCETITKDAADYSVTSCESFPCIINCNAASSCRGGISCPSTGSGSCTINADGNYAVYNKQIDCGTATDITLNMNGLSSFYSGILNCDSTTTINSLTLTTTGHMASQNAAFNIAGSINDLTVSSDLSAGSNSGGFYNADLTVAGSVNNDVTFNINDDLHSWYSGSITIGSIGGDLSVSVVGDTASRGRSFKLTTITIGNIGGSVNFNDASAYGRSFHATTITIGDIGGTNGARFIDASEDGGHSFVSTDITIGAVTNNLLFQTEIDNGGQGFDLSTFAITSVGGGLSFLSNSFGTFSECRATVSGDITGNFIVTDTSSGGHGGYNSFFTVNGNIGGSVLVRDETMGSGGGRSFHSTEWTLSYPDNTIGGNVEFIENSEYGNAFSAGRYYIGNVAGSTIFQTVQDSGQQGFDVSIFGITSVGADLSFLSNSFGTFSECTATVTGDIGGNFIVTDTAIRGYGGYNSKFTVSGNIGGNVLVRDDTVETAQGGRSFHSTEWTLSYPDNTIGGDVSFIENSGFGNSFSSSPYKLGNVVGNTLFQTVVDNGRQGFDLSTYAITSVGGHLSFLSNSFGTFSENTATVTGNVGGNFIVTDTSSGGHGGYNSFFTVNGNIDGSVLVSDETTGTSGGRSFHSTEWTLSYPDNSIGGDVSFIENSEYGYSFSIGTYKIGNVAGNGLFNNMQDNGRQSFDVSKFYIASIGGGLSFLSNSFGAFSECLFYITTVTGTTLFRGLASGGYDFFSADIEIENCPLVQIQVGTSHGIYDSHNVFGDGVGVVDVAINGGVNSLYSTIFDARAADELILTCSGDGDCHAPQIYCPEDNKANKCRVYCSADSNCDNIDLFTTNGYCSDASFNCVAGESCSVAATSQVFCQFDATKALYGNYGQRVKQCTMNTDTDGSLTCADASTSGCNSCTTTQTPTKGPTKRPTKGPTKSPTQDPTKGPTKSPTKAPTKAPTFEPCTASAVVMNVAFIIDESGSVESGDGNELNYDNSIDFVIDLVTNSVNSVSRVAAMAFSTSNDIIYQFSEDQTSRSSINSALETEKTNYAAQWTDTYNAVIGGIDLFSAAATGATEDVMFLITDGQPWCSSGDTGCVEDVCPLYSSLVAAGVDVYIIGVGNFNVGLISCLVNDDADKVYALTDFTDASFRAIEARIRSDILCPASSNGIFDINYNNNNLVLLDITISVIAILTIFASLSFAFYCCYTKCIKKASKYEMVSEADDV